MVAVLLYLIVLGFCARICILGDIGKSPLYWLVVPWVIVTCPIIFGVITYSRPAIGPMVLMFVLTQLLSIGLGYWVVFLTSKRRRAVGHTDRSYLFADRKREFASISSIVNVSVLIGIVGALLIAIDGYFVSGFADQNNALDVRVSFINTEASNVGRLAPMLGWGGFVSLLALVWFGPSILQRRTKFYIAGALAVSLFSILTAGRQAIFQLLLFSAIGWLVQRPSGQSIGIRGMSVSRLLGIVPLFSVAIFSMVSMIVSRGSSEITNQLEYLLFIFGASLDPEFRDIIVGIGDSFSAAIVGTLIYFSSQISSLAAVIDPAASETWAIGNGGMQFPWLYRRFEFLGIQSIDDFMAIRRDYLRQSGSMSHSWSTSLGNFVNDFGLAGSYIYCVFVGIFGGYAFVNHSAKNSFFSFCLLVASFVYLFYLIMIPASSDSLFFFFVLMVFAYDLIFGRRLMVMRRAREIRSYFIER